MSKKQTHTEQLVADELKALRQHYASSWDDMTDFAKMDRLHARLFMVVVKAGMRPDDSIPTSFVQDLHAAACKLVHGTN